MIEEKETVEKAANDVTNNTEVDYIAALNQLKENSVSRETYDKLREDNKKLLNTLVNGGNIEVKKEEPLDESALRHTLFGGDTVSNLNYVDAALKLRKAVMDKGERDPFLPYGDYAKVGTTELEGAENVAAILQECVDFAQGDDGIFTAELMRRTSDTARMGGKSNRR